MAQKDIKYNTVFIKNNFVKKKSVSNRSNTKYIWIQNKINTYVIEMAQKDNYNQKLL